MDLKILKEWVESLVGQACCFKERQVYVVSCAEKSLMPVAHGISCIACLKGADVAIITGEPRKTAHASSVIGAEGYFMIKDDFGEISVEYRGCQETKKTCKNKRFFTYSICETIGRITVLNDI